MSKLHRDDLGPHFSEWCRLVWVALRKLEKDQAWLARELGVGSGTINRWIYGDRKPGIDGLLGVERVLGVPVSAVQLQPARKFRPPGATTRAA